MDFKKLEKLLQLTQSDNDNEALSAIRKANRMLRAGETSWAHFLGLERPKAPASRIVKNSAPMLEQLLDAAEIQARRAQCNDLLERIRSFRKECFQ